MIINSQGEVFYGMHFYPGVAEYDDPKQGAYRVFLNSDTIRSMDKSFAGRPVYVHHVDGVEENLDDLRGEVDGWVSESFYNAHDGKHWVKFIVVSEAGKEAIRQGMRLSNCYVPKSFGPGGLWNNVQYSKEITGGEYEHLAIVPNPRYDESVILTPDEFKAYNESKNVDLQRLANSKKRKAESSMAFKIFSRTKVENAKAEELANFVVLLPKTKREITIEKLVNEADELMSKPTALEIDGKAMTIDELVTAYKAAMARIEDLEASDDEDDYEDDDSMENAEDDDSMENAEDDEDDETPAPKKKKENDEPPAKKTEAVPPKKSAKESKDKAGVKNSREKNRAKADRLRHANAETAEPMVVIDLDQTARGKARYGR